MIDIAWPPETFLGLLIKGLMKKGAYIYVAGPKKPDQVWLNDRHFRWLYVPSRVPPTLWAPLLARLNQCNIIYFPWNSGAVENMPLLDMGIPTVISCRGSQINIAPHDPNRREFSNSIRTTFDKATMIHCVSENIKRECFRYGLDPNKGKIIRPAVDTEYFTPPNHRVTSGCLEVITTGSLIWRKGYEYALVAIDRMKKKGISVRLSIIGGGQEYQRLFYTIQDLNLEKEVTLLGVLDSSEVRDYLRKSDVFLLSSLSEGISNAVLEAMACGLPIVTTDCGGMTEAVTDNIEGYVTPVRRPDMLASALEKLANDTEKRNQMGSAARDRVLKEFKIQDQITKFIHLFENVKNEKPCLK